MRWKSTLFLLFLVLGIGGFIWFLEREGTGSEERAEEARRALRIDPDAVTALRIHTSNYVLSCYNDNESWRIEEPIRTQADSGRIKRILVGLQNLPKGQVITEREREENNLRLHDFGLALPHATIRVSQNGVERTILVGGRSPIGDSIYLMESNQAAIVATSAALWDIIPDDVSEVRSRRLLHGATLQLKRIEIRRAAGFLQVGLSEGGVWMLQQPVVGRANPAFVRDLATKLLTIDVADFVEDNVTDFAPYGLDDPVVGATLWPEADAGTYSVSIGNPVADNPELLYARTGDSDSVYAVSKQIRTDMNIDFEILRDRRLLNVLPDRVRYIRIQEGERELALQRDDAGAWSLIKPVQKPAESALVRALVGAWVDLRIDRFESNAATNIDTLAVDGPFRTIVLATRPPVESESGSDGPPLEEGKNKTTLAIFAIPGREDQVYVTTPHEDAVYAVAADALRDAPIEPLVYYDREVLRLRPEDIRTIDVQRNGMRQRVAADEAGRFHPDPADSGELLQAVIDNILHDVNPLRVEGYVAGNAPDLSRYGLDASAHAILFGLTAEAGISKTLLIGSDAGPNGVYATIRGQDAVFVLSRSVAGRLLSDFVIRAASTQEDSVVSTNTTPVAP